jgi:type I restriction enzyme S subunit
MMKAYPEYKESEVKWLNKIPSHWNDMRVKYSLLKKEDNNVGEEWKTTQLLSLTQKGVIKKDINKGAGKTHSDYSTYQVVEPNELVFCLFDLDETPRTVGLSKFDGMITSAYTVFECLKGADNDFLYYFFESIDDHKGLKPFYSGMRKTVRKPTFSNIKIPQPPIEEQELIGDFLIKESSRIDNLIFEKENFIKLLSEKRQALISHIVTKGSNPNVKMKDSGVEWIGEMPEHWEMTKLRYLGICQNGINIGGECFGSGFPFISYGDVYKNRSLPHKVKGLVESTTKDKELYSVKSGDVLFTRTSETIEEIGFTSVCHKDMTDAVFAGFLIRFRPKENAIDPLFSEYYFQNEQLRSFFVKEMNLVTRASLSQELLKKMPVPIPPMDEQKDIAAYISNKTNKLNLLVSETKNSIELLKEHRTALISAAVTGKIDVRENT